MKQERARPSAVWWSLSLSNYASCLRLNSQFKFRNWKYSQFSSKWQTHFRMQHTKLSLYEFVIISTWCYVRCLVCFSANQGLVLLCNFYVILGSEDGYRIPFPFGVSFVQCELYDLPGKPCNTSENPYTDMMLWSCRHLARVAATLG